MWGLADPQALRLTLDAKEAYEALGSPEGDLALYQAVLYLAPQPLKVIGFTSLKKRWKLGLKRWVELPPPKNIINPVNKWMKSQGFGKGYVYEPETPHEVSTQPFLPDGVERKSCYEPTERGFEREIKRRVVELLKGRGL